MTVSGQVLSFLADYKIEVGDKLSDSPIKGISASKKETSSDDPSLWVSSERGQYPIFIGSRFVMKDEIWNSLFSITSGMAKILIVADENVIGFHSDFIDWFEEYAQLRYGSISVKVVKLPAGEKTKSLEYLDLLWSEMADFEMTRNDVLITVGGGVIGDLSGFAASTFNRGLRWVQVPTTLLSQVDSSVGGKVAINRESGKNLVGTFYSPNAVLIDTRFLRTLPLRQFSNGLAEVIKHAYIGDQSIFEVVEKVYGAETAGPGKGSDVGRSDHFEASAISNERYSKEDSILQLVEDCYLEELLLTAVRVKVHVVEQDERENGIRAILNFGHTYAHGIEAALSFDHAYHGEAVGLGMLFAIAFGEWLKLQRDCLSYGGIGTTSSELAKLAWQSEQVHLLRDRLKSVGLPTEVGVFGLQLMDAIPYICHDKKRTGDFISFVFVETEGCAKVEKTHLSTIEEFARISAGLDIVTI